MAWCPAEAITRPTSSRSVCTSSTASIVCIVRSPDSCDPWFELGIEHGLHEDGVEAGRLELRGSLGRAELEHRDERDVAEIGALAERARGVARVRRRRVEDHRPRALTQDG